MIDPTSNMLNFRNLFVNYPNAGTWSTSPWCFMLNLKSFLQKNPAAHIRKKVSNYIASVLNASKTW